MLASFLRRRRRRARRAAIQNKGSLYLAECCEPRLLLAAIGSDQTITASITAVGQVDSYTFSASAGQSIFAAVAETVAGSPLSVSIELRAPNNALVTSGSSATGTAILAQSNLVTQSGTYTINIRGLNNTLGSYALTLALPGVAPEPGTDAGPIASAEYHTAAISTADLDVYTIAGTAGGSLLATIGDLDASGFDPQIHVFSPSGALLGNSAGPSGTVVLETALPATGTYYIVASDQLSDETGNYGITIATFGGTQVAGNDGGPISSGAYRTGTIDPGDFDVHTISGTAGGSLLAAMGDLDPANSGFDPQILVFSPTGASLANVVSPNGTNTLLQNLATTGTYYVVTLDQFADETGAYGLSVATFGGTQVTDADSGAINSGERKTGTIDMGDFDIYTISATSGGSLLSAIGDTAAAAGFAPQILVFSPSGALLDSAPAPTGTNSLLENLAATGTYYVVALDQFSDQTGAYALSVARFGGSQTATPGDDGGPIASGDYRTGSVQIGDFDVYTIQASAGNTLVAALGETATGLAMEPQLIVFSPTGQRLITTQGQDGTSTLLSNLPATGSYAVVALDQFSDETGDYGLSVVRLGTGATAPAIPAGDEGGALNSAERRPGLIRPGDIDAYSFDLAAGNGAFWTVGETVENSLAPRLIVVGPTGNVISNTTGARGTAASLVAAGAATAGTYFALVMDGAGGEPGEYALTGVAVPAVQMPDDVDSGSLAPNQPRAGALPPGDADVYTVVANAGQPLTFTLGRTGPTTLTPGLIVYGPTGAIAGSNFSATTAQVNIASAAAGTYTAVVYDSGGDGSGAYSIALNGAVGADTFAPRLLESAYRYNDHTPSVRLVFSEDVSASFQPDDFVLKNLTTNQTIDPANLSITFTTITHEIYFGTAPLPGGVLPDGNYQLTIPAANLTDAGNIPLNQAISLDFFVLGGDANRDRHVDFNDLVVLAQHYNVTGGQTWITGDFNYDGNVDFNDLVILAQRYNTQLPAPAALPAAAPASIVAADTTTGGGDRKAIFSTVPVRRPAPVKRESTVRGAHR